jgi:dolichol-phosphate mannosyltransferase
VRLQVFVLVPTYNEAENLPVLVSALFALPLDLSVLIIDDGSPDGTAEIAANLAAGNPRLRLLKRTAKRGLRLAYLAGFHQALSEDPYSILQMDADLSHDPARIPEMFGQLKDCDLVLGSRYVAGGSIDSEWPRWRQALSGFGNLYARTILGLKIRDVTTGFRLWRAERLRALPLDRLRSNGYVFLVEMAYVASRLGLRIRETPIHFMERQHGSSKMSLRIQTEAALRVWQLRWNYRDLASKRIGDSAAQRPVADK